MSLLFKYSYLPSVGTAAASPAILSAAATATAVYAVSLKLPTFLASRPDVWFQQTEAQFALRNITDSTAKYFYLFTSLDPVVAERWPEMWQQYLQKASTST